MFSSKPFLFGTIVDVPLWVHPGAVVLCALAAVPCAIRDPLAALILITVLVASILAHEVGHALAARSMGLRVAAIHHLGIGGYCVFEDSGRCTESRCTVAAAGPLANFLIALALLPPALSLPGNSHSATIFGAAVTMNAALCVGNLLPIFPLDGSQILCALLSRRWSERTAVLATAGIGTVLAIPAVTLACIMAIVGIPCALMAPWSVNWSTFKQAWRYRDEGRPNNPGPRLPNRPWPRAAEADRLMAAILAEQGGRNARRRAEREAEFTKRGP